MLNPSIISNKKPSLQTVSTEKRKKSFFQPVIQSKLTINQPNDIYEQEADAVAEKVMRMPDSKTEPLFFPPQPLPVMTVQRKCAACESEEKLHRKEDEEEEPVQLKPIKDFDVQRKRSHCEEEEEKAQMKGGATAAATMAAPSIVHNVIRSGGQPLDRSTRNFMESRFGYDFGNVQIHDDPLAHQSSKEINALAYTHRNHVVFGSGQYQPNTNSGKQLLAHELAHVVQQEKNIRLNQHIQCAKIGYRTITLADFKEPWSVVYTASAEITTGFDIPSYSASPTLKETKTKCKIGAVKGKMVEAEIQMDPSQFDGLVAYMDQEESWIKDRFKDGGVAYCAYKAKVCEKDFEDAAQKAGAICKTAADDCDTAFKNRTSNFRYKIGNNTIVAQQRSHCQYTFLDQCKETYRKQHFFKLSPTNIARSKAECSAELQSKCKTNEAEILKNLLKHEQGHFDITNIIANKAKAGLKAKAGKVLKEKACGREEVSKLIDNSYGKLRDEIGQLGKDWHNERDRAQKDYDDQTVNGTKEPEQKRWEQDITKGLPQYDISTGVAIPATP